MIDYSKILGLIKKNGIKTDNMENLEEILLDNSQINRKSKKKINSMQQEIDAILKNTPYHSEELNLSNMGIENVDFLSKYTNLKILDLGNNYIANIEPIRYLKKIQLLNLANNEIEDINSLSDLSELLIIKLENNKIKDITPLKKIVESGIPIKLRKDINIKGIHLFNNPINNPPIDIVKMGNNSIVKFWHEKNIQGVEKIFEAKLLIVGEGGVGKTSLAWKIKNIDSELPSSDFTTRGIDIEPINFTFLEKGNQKNFRMNIWDFGGQQIYHSTHQFFLTKKSLYILLMDTRTENHNFDYWLQTIELFSDQSPVIILQNIHQGRNVPFDERGIKGRFLNIKEIVKVDLKNDRNGIEKLVDTIRYYIKNLKHVGEELPKQWVLIRKDVELESKLKNYISKERFFEICEKNSIKERSRQLFLSQYLHDLGVMLHFQNDPGLDNLVVLNNLWATDAVYKVLDYLNTLNIGEFCSEDWNKIWNEEIYRDKHTELVSLMKKFELCYQIDNQNRYIVPKCLPRNEPDLDFILFRSNKKSILIRYEYDFMPKGIIPRFIVRMHHRIKSQELVWSTGVVLEERETIAVVKELYAERKVVVQVVGKEPQLLLSKIIDNIDAIHMGFSSEFRVKKLIPCNCLNCSESDDKYYHDYQFLLKAKELSKTIQCQNSFENIKPDELLDNTFKQKKHMKKVFFSYSHQDEDIKNFVDKHFASLKRSKLIEVWNDRAIKAGEDFDQKIRSELEEADIILLFISSNFNNSEYIWNIELKKAIERHEKKEAIVVPVFARACDFKDMPYAKLQGFPKDRKFIYNSSEKEKDKLCIEVANAIRGLIEN